MPTPRPTPNDITLLALNGAFRGKGWQGPTLSGCVRSVRAGEALRRPGRSRKCIWEQVLHAAYWKYTILRQVSGREDVSFPRSPANWPRMPARPDEAAWKADRALLARVHSELIAAVEGLEPSRLGTIPPRGRRWTYAQLLVGIAAHDAYHTGQIRLIRKLVARGG